MATDWIATDSCEATARFGWFVAMATGGLADIVLVSLIASAPKLGKRRRHPRWKNLRTGLQRSLVLLPVIWVICGYCGRAFLPCYTAALAYGSALTIGIVLLLAVLTAANQIGTRSVR
jgi:hypothetical protein